MLDASQVLFSSNTAFYLSIVEPAQEVYGKYVYDKEKVEFITRKIQCLVGNPPPQQERSSRLSSTKKESLFPIAQPCSFRRSSVTAIMRKKNIDEPAFLCSLKTDGVRALLLLTTFRGVPISVLVDRKMRISNIEVWAPKCFFEDTLFDGEIVVEKAKARPTKQDIFLAFDVYSCCGKSLLLDDYSTRVKCMHEKIYVNQPESDSSFDVEDILSEREQVFVPPHVGIELRAKRVCASTSAKEVWKLRLSTPWLNDGLIFTANEPVLSNNVVYKWKPCHTIDLLVKKNDLSRPLVLQGGVSRHFKQVVENGITYLLGNVFPNTLLNKHFEAIKNTSCVFECAMTIEKESRVVSFFPIRVRNDKTSPNSLYTLKETILNVIEDIGVEEMIEEPPPPAAARRPPPPSAIPPPRRKAPPPQQRRARQRRS